MRCSSPMESRTFESNVNNLHLTNRKNRRKVKEPFQNSNSLMRCSSPMTSWTIKSNVSISHLTNQPNRSNRQKVMGPFYNRDFFLSLANDRQQSNGKLDYQIESKYSPFDKSIKSIESTKSYRALLQQRYFSKSH